jgi:hypothetical protein
MHNLLQRFYNRKFGDYGTMQTCRAISETHKMWQSTGRYTREDWQEKHEVWTLEPLGG